MTENGPYPWTFPFPLIDTPDMSSTKGYRVTVTDRLFIGLELMSGLYGSVRVRTGGMSAGMQKRPGGMSDRGISGGKCVEQHVLYSRDDRSA